MRAETERILRTIRNPSEPPVIMGILNATPDSFYAASRALGSAASRKAEQLIEAGADIIDIGGESTRPGSRYVSEQEEIDRVVPVIESVRKGSAIPISIDTRKAGTAKAAYSAGADIVNDISALEDDPNLFDWVREMRVPVVLMHKQGRPETMQHDPRYADPGKEIASYLAGRSRALIEAGYPGELIIVDPGIGFGKTYEHTVEVLACLDDIITSVQPFCAGVLLGHSRKSFLGTVLGGESGTRPADERLSGGLGIALWGVRLGVRCLRVHDVAETKDAVRAWWTLESARRRKGHKR